MVRDYGIIEPQDAPAATPAAVNPNKGGATNTPTPNAAPKARLFARENHIVHDASVCGMFVSGAGKWQKEDLPKFGMGVRRCGCG